MTTNATDINISEYQHIKRANSYQVCLQLVAFFAVAISVVFQLPPLFDLSSPVTCEDRIKSIVQFSKQMSRLFEITNGHILM